MVRRFTCVLFLHAARENMAHLWNVKYLVSMFYSDSYDIQYLLKLAH